MSLEVVKSVLTVRMVCNFKGCSCAQIFEGAKIEDIEKEAKKAGWRTHSYGPGTKRDDWCSSHWRTCPTCKGIPVAHLDDDGKKCLCQGSYHEVEVDKCRSCHGMLVQLDREPS